MNSHDLQRMNDHDYLPKKKWSISRAMRREKYLACGLWIIGILTITTTLIILIR